MTRRETLREGRRLPRPVGEDGSRKASENRNLQAKAQQSFDFEQRNERPTCTPAPADMPRAGARAILAMAHFTGAGALLFGAVTASARGDALAAILFGGACMGVFMLGLLWGAGELE